MSTTISCNHCTHTVTSDDVVEALEASDRHIATKHPETKGKAKDGDPVTPAPDVPMRERIAEAHRVSQPGYSTSKVPTQTMPAPKMKAAAPAALKAHREARDVMGSRSPYMAIRTGTAPETMVMAHSAAPTLNIATRLAGTNQPTSHVHSQRVHSPAKNQLNTRSEKTFGTLRFYAGKRSSQQHAVTALTAVIAAIKEGKA